jgi:tRNA G18 (ribose-2'-O)-methylase SpoU
MSKEKPILIEDLDLSLLANIKEKDLTAQGLMVLEGRIVIEKALESGIVPRFLVCTEAQEEYWQKRTKEIYAIQDDGAVGGDDVRESVFPMHIVSHDSVCNLVDFRFHRGAIAVAEIPQIKPFDLSSRGIEMPESSRCRLYLCLWNVTDPSNLGALIRTAVCLGAAAILLGPGCANPYYRKTIRASMGNVFCIPIWSVDLNILEKFDRQGAKIIAAALTEKAIKPQELKFAFSRQTSENSPALDYRSDSAILLLGNEGYGLPTEVLALTDIQVRIPMAAGSDSLNVAVAGGILMYEIVRSF